jgi:signal transduction histidine kinase
MEVRWRQISTRPPPGAAACQATRTDTFEHVVLASFTRRRRTLGRPADLLAGLRDGSSVAAVDVPLAVNVIRFAVLIAMLVSVPLFSPHFGSGAEGIVTAVALAISAVAWLVWQFAGHRPRLWLVTLVVMGAAGGVLAGLSSLSTAVAVGCVVAVSAGARLPAEASFAVVAETVAAFLIAGIVSGAPAEAIAGWSSGFVGFWAFGLTRHAYLLRAEEAEDALEQARRAHAAETQAAALAERARIAREIHDVLAHSLAAVSVNLQAAEGLLDALPGQGPEVAKAVECVQRAGALTREGMAETRRAILALRDDTDGDAPGYVSTATARPSADALADTAGATADGEPGARFGRLVGRLRSLADEHRAAGDAAVDFTVTGTPRPLGADAALTAFRTTQESLTNARKHAPGQPVSIAVNYHLREMTLRVSNPLPPAGPPAMTSTVPLADTGAGYGLTGLRERAALAGGTLAAGEDGGQWQVRLRLPG